MQLKIKENLKDKGETNRKLKMKIERIIKTILNK